jgi:tRNA-dependent cyclodipeptide synthase
MTEGGLHVAQSVGIAEAGDGELNANLGISFSKTTYFSKNVMSEYIRWVGERFGKLLIIVADHLEAHNAQVFKGYSFSTALEKTKETGRQLRSAYLRAIPAGLTGRVTVNLASELLEEPGCCSLLAVVQQCAADNKRFADDLRASVESGLAGKLRQAREEGMQIGDSAMRILENYIVEEVAIILYLSHQSPTLYPVLIFPHFVPAVIPRIYSGEYNGAFEKITGGHGLRAMQVVPRESGERGDRSGVGNG